MIFKRLKLQVLGVYIQLMLTDVWKLVMNAENLSIHDQLMLTDVWKLVMNG